MQRRTVCLALSLAFVLALFLASCASPPVASSTSAATPAPNTSSSRTAPPTPTTDSPKYGGVLTIMLPADLQGFDEIPTQPTQLNTMHLTNEELATGDWTLGPAGSGKVTWTFANSRLDCRTGSVAESWSSPDPGHLIFKIRQGMHFSLNPSSDASRLVNGREVTADDVVYSFNRVFGDPNSYVAKSYPQVAANTKVVAPDKRTVDMKVPVDTFADFSTLPDYVSIVPSEVANKYGSLRDWRNSVGTGPFLLSDYVSASSVTFVKNPNYWGTDPVGQGKGNRLPYLDGAKMLVIPDRSTQLAAIRTAKLDVIGAGSFGNSVIKDDAASLMKTTPDLKYLKFLSDQVNTITMRLDKPQLPFKDKNVRRALMMATDFNAIKNQIYGGEAEILGWPITPQKELVNAYLPLDQAPASAQELWTYNPDKAKQLLADAGYPSGFKTKITCDSLLSDDIAVIKSMWAKVGVDVTIDPKETAVMTSIRNNKSVEEMAYTQKGSSGAYYKLLNMYPTGPSNLSMINDSYVNQVRTQVFSAFAALDEAKTDQLHKDLMKYVLDQAWVVPMPAPYGYIFWWPWVKNYHGEMSIGYDNTPNWVKFVWIDQGLKEGMVGRR